MPATNNDKSIIIFAISEEMEHMETDQDYLQKLHETASIRLLAEQSVPSNLPGPKIDQVLSLKDPEKYRHEATISECEPRRSIVIGTDLNHIRAANKADFQGILLHDAKLLGPEAVCSAYSASGVAGERTTLNEAIGRILGVTIDPKSVTSSSNPDQAEQEIRDKEGLIIFAIFEGKTKIDLDLIEAFQEEMGILCALRAGTTMLDSTLVSPGISEAYKRLSQNYGYKPENTVFISSDFVLAHEVHKAGFPTLWIREEELSLNSPVFRFMASGGINRSSIANAISEIRQEWNPDPDRPETSSPISQLKKAPKPSWLQ